MICPNCEYEYIEGITKCADCGSDLVPVEEFKENLVTSEDWIIVYTDSEMYVVEMLAANLNSAEIETSILGQKDRNYPGPGDLSVIKLFVRKRDIDDALAIIEDINKNGSPEE